MKSDSKQKIGVPNANKLNSNISLYNTGRTSAAKKDKAPGGGKIQTQTQNSEYVLQTYQSKVAFSGLEKEQQNLTSQVSEVSYNNFLGDH